MSASGGSVLVTCTWWLFRRYINEIVLLKSLAESLGLIVRKTLIFRVVTLSSSFRRSVFDLKGDRSLGESVAFWSLKF